jgi:TetR/AcrR family transcriptional repressor of bet genes
MVRLKIRDFRRNEIIDAAIATIAESGLSNTTLAMIATQAGVSPALVNHYFDGKEELLEATMRRLTKDLAGTIWKLLPPEPTPLDRVHAIIDGCLTPEHFGPGTMLAWLSCWVQIPGNPRFAKLQRTINRRFHSNLIFALRSLVPEELVEETAVGLFALIDGFWLRQWIDRGGVELPFARLVCRNYIARVCA